MSGIRDKAHIFLKHYNYMNEVFRRKFGYKLYFIGGTLLGYIRENDFLKKDKDMDVSYFSKFDSVSDVKKEIIEIINTLIDNGENLYFIRNDYSVIHNYFRWRVDEDDRIDVMPTWFQNGMIYRSTFVGYKGSKNIIMPLQEKKFYGHKIYIPNKPKQKLEKVYGYDWKIPNEKFKKKDRKDKSTTLILDKKLNFGKQVMKKLIKKTNEWQKLNFFEKVMVLFNLSFLSNIPLVRRYKTSIFGRVNKYCFKHK